MLHPHLSYGPCRYSTLDKISDTSGLQVAMVVKGSLVNNSHYRRYSVDTTIMGDVMVVRGMNAAYTNVI